MWLMQIILLCVSGVRLSFAYGSGAPPKSCHFMTPGHLSSLGIPIPEQSEVSSKYTIKADWDDKRQYVRLSITGSTFQGFLIQARETTDGPAVGNFKMLPKDSAKYQNCQNEQKFNPEASITHTSPSDKSNLTFLWAPSSGQNGNVTFYATLAETKNVFWHKLPSNQVTLMESTSGTSSPEIRTTHSSKMTTSSAVTMHSVFSVTLALVIITVLTAFNGRI